MPNIAKLLNVVFKNRNNEIDRFMRNPIEVQNEQFKWLLSNGVQTRFGLEKALTKDSSLGEFQRMVQIQDYNTYQPYVDQIRAGEQNVLWPSKVKWLAKSSGTTDSKSKYIPVTKEALERMHLQGPKDVMLLYLATHPQTSVLSGRTLTLGGSRKIELEGSDILSGDLSAILIENTPLWASFLRAPSVQTALIANFDQKVEQIYKETKDQNITSFAGVPSWNLVMMNRILEMSGKSNLLELWPNLELFIHGGMNFNPYREQFKGIIPSDNMHYMETYNASEGFFAIGDQEQRDDMLLMLDYGIFYEFQPMNSLNDPTTVVPLEGVECGVNYAMIITSCNGLWRYMIGDTVVFTSTSPYRIKISGRTKHYVNAFGEELIVDNAEQAIRAACDATGAEVREFSAAPIYMEGRNKGSHQWVIEFVKNPNDITTFASVLDDKLQSINSDYEAKRTKNTTLLAPTITPLKEGTFNKWMVSRNKIGGQNKVQRLSNDRTIIEELIQIGALCI